MSQPQKFLAKRNLDGSYSIRMTAQQLTDAGWVDFYDDKTGDGYQRRETLRERRGREIEDYFRRCNNEGVVPRLFEMTASTRCPSSDGSVTGTFSPLDADGQLGEFEVDHGDQPWLSMIDGGTRLLGIERALASNVIDADASFDVRVFMDLAVAEEVALFLLINEKQKRVRTDLGIRVVQRKLDEGTLTDEEQRTLKTVVPDTDQWKYEASRIAARLNTASDSDWAGLVQMPGDNVSKPIKLQAFWTSLKHLLDDADIKARLRQMEADGTFSGGNATDFVVTVLTNFWRAVAEVNPDARSEPKTNVLWGSIGVNASHQALSEVMKSILSGETPDLTKKRFVEMISESEIADYDYWFTKAGTSREDYPREKGDATTMTGGSGYSRLAKILEEQWRAALHSAGASKAVLV